MTYVWQNVCEYVSSHMNKTPCEYVLSHIWIWHNTFICVIKHIHPSHTHTHTHTHTAPIQTPFPMCVPWLTDSSAMTHSCTSEITSGVPPPPAHFTFHMCVPWLTHARAMTHSCVCDITLEDPPAPARLPFPMCVPWLTHSSAVYPFTCVYHDSLIPVTWLIHTCMT